MHLYFSFADTASSVHGIGLFGIRIDSKLKTRQFQPPGSEEYNPLLYLEQHVTSLTVRGKDNDWIGFSGA